MLIDWDNYEAHEKWMAHPTYPSFLTLGQSIASGPLGMIHIAFDPFPPTDALKGPIVELAIIKLKPEAKFEAFGVVARKLGELLDANKECVGRAVGRVKEDERAIGVVASWTSVEVSIYRIILRES